MPVVRCFQRLGIDQSVDISWFLSIPLYMQDLTSLVIHDTFWPQGKDSLACMPQLQLLTVLYAGHLANPDICLGHEGSATLDCPALQALCFGAIVREYGNLDWMKVPTARVLFFIQTLLGWGGTTIPNAQQKVKELCFMNLKLVDEEKDKLEALTEKLWYEDDLDWDGLWF